MNCLEIEIWHSFLLLLLFSDTQTFPFFLACTLYKKNKLPIPPRSPKVRIGPAKKYEGGGLSTHLHFPGKSIYLTLPGSPAQDSQLSARVHYKRMGRRNFLISYGAGSLKGDGELLSLFYCFYMFSIGFLGKQMLSSLSSCFFSESKQCFIALK